MANKKKCIVKGNSGGNVSGLSGLGYPPFSVPYVISEMPPEQKKKEIVIEGELNEIYISAEAIAAIDGDILSPVPSMLYVIGVHLPFKACISPP